MNAPSTVWQGAGRRIHMQEVGLRDGLQMLDTLAVGVGTLRRMQQQRDARQVLRDRVVDLAGQSRALRDRSGGALGLGGPVLREFGLAEQALMLARILVGRP